jgi:hypothetical protein
MSRTTLHCFGSSGDIYDFREFQNAWGSAMFIWNAMVGKYLEPPRPSWVHDDSDFLPISAYMFDGDDKWDAVWALARREDIPAHHRVVHCTTFDRVLVNADDFLLLADAFDRFVDDFPPNGLTCSLRDQAQALRDMHADGTWQAAGWTQTSVSDGGWWVYGESDEDEGHSYNINTDTGHWFLDVADSLTPRT